MKFITYAYDGKIQAGILEDNNVISINEVFEKLELPQINGLQEFIEIANEKFIKMLAAVLNSNKFSKLALAQVKLLAPIPYPKRNVLCIGKNYEEHAKEIKITQISDTFIPDNPIYFTKAASPATATGEKNNFL